MIKIGEDVVQSIHAEVGVLTPSGEVVEYDSMQAACAAATMFGGLVQARRVYVGKWIPVPDELQPRYLVA